MRIGIDIRLPTYRMGGISQYILHLVPALAEIDVQNEYFLFHSWKEKRSFLPASAPLFSRQRVWTPCHHRLERWTLAAEMRRFNLDVLHSPDFIPPSSGARRRVITIHDLNFVHFPQFLTEESRRFYLDQIQWAADAADHISVDSHSTGRDVVELLQVSKEKVTTIHLAANPLYEQSYGREDIEETVRKYKLPIGFILFVGTLEPRKNLPMLIRVYDRLRRDHRLEVPLILVGGLGWMYDAIFATIDELHLTRYVHHVPGVTDLELAHLYHAAGVLVTPSFFEGFGLPALEAQHCGCPVIVSNRGSLPEIVGEQGVKLDPDDFDSWVKTIANVLSESELRKSMIAYGREHAKAFTWQKAARKTLDIYLNG